MRALFGQDAIGECADSDGELVVVRPSVLATVDHACGNIFQKLYHLLRTTRSGSNHSSAALEDTIRQLQSLIELFLDYVAPTSVQPQPIRVVSLLASFRGHLDDQLAGPVEVDMTGDDCTTVVADPVRLGRAFQLLAQSAGAPGREGTLQLQCRLSSGRTHFEITVSHRPGGAGDAELRWAVAEKLVDLQGGELRQDLRSDGVRWTLRLPLATA
jgi:hypothetical protein